MTLVERFEQRLVALEVWRLAIRMTDGFKVCLVPGVIPHDPNLVDGNVFSLRAAAIHRDGQPLLALGQS